MEDKTRKKLVEDGVRHRPGVDAADIGVRLENGIVQLDRT